jgi:hypothetical protein
VFSLIGTIVIGLLLARAAIALLPTATITITNGANCPAVVIGGRERTLARVVGVHLFDTLPADGSDVVTGPAVLVRGVSIAQHGRSLTIGTPGGAFPPVELAPEVVAVEVEGTALDGRGTIALSDQMTLRIVCR